MLGRPFFLRGKVVKGNARGRHIGYPTANLVVDGKMVVPKEGVYAVSLLIEGRRHYGVMNIGRNPTFGGEGRESSLEVHVIGLSANLYGRDLTVFFHERLRDEIRFESVEELKSQIREDIRRASRIFRLGEGIPNADLMPVYKAGDL